LNSYEIAILRILVKRNFEPIAIHNLIEGFPDGSEDKVNDAISNLKNLELISVLSGFPIEEKYVIYNQDKKQEILKIIDPLYGKIKENRIDINGYIYNNRVKVNRNKNKNYKLSLGQFTRPAINITISIIFVIVIAFVFTTIPQTTEIEQVYDFPYKYSKFKNGESQVYGNDDKDHWKVKAMNKDFRNHFIYYHQFDKTENLSIRGVSYCQNA
jgi:hypothetical protein